MRQLTFHAFLIVLCVIGWAVILSLGVIVVPVVGAAVWLARKRTQ
jgi:hypothetical protein